MCATYAARPGRFSLQRGQLNQSTSFWFGSTAVVCDRVLGVALRRSGVSSQLGEGERFSELGGRDMIFRLGVLGRNFFRSSGSSSSSESSDVAPGFELLASSAPLVSSSLSSSGGAGVGLTEPGTKYIYIYDRRLRCAGDQETQGGTQQQVLAQRSEYLRRSAQVRKEERLPAGISLTQVTGEMISDIGGAGLTISRVGAGVPGV